MNIIFQQRTFLKPLHVGFFLLRLNGLLIVRGRNGRRLKVMLSTMYEVLHISRRIYIYHIYNV